MSQFNTDDDNIIDLPDPRTRERILGQLSGPALDADNALQQAQELMYDAWETPDPVERIELAEQALETSPDCADAWVLLAEETAENLEQAIEFYQKGLEAGERALSPEMFAEDAGRFWGILKTRPYMRAREGLANCLWEAKKYTDAIGHYQAMLELNPVDNQGIRHILITCLVSTRQYAAAWELINKYEEDVMAEWAYSRALLSFIENGDNPESRQHRARAITQNKHIPAYLGGRRKLPSFPYEYIRVGDKTEAVNFALENREIWRAIPGAIGWLMQATDKKRRNRKRA